MFFPNQFKVHTSGRLNSTEKEKTYLCSFSTDTDPRVLWIKWCQKCFKKYIYILKKNTDPVNQMMEHQTPSCGSSFIFRSQMLKIICISMGNFFKKSHDMILFTCTLSLFLHIRGLFEDEDLLVLIVNFTFLDVIASPSTYPCQWVGQ